MDSPKGQIVDVWGKQAVEGSIILNSASALNQAKFISPAANAVFLRQSNRKALSRRLAITWRPSGSRDMTAKAFHRFELLHTSYPASGPFAWYQLYSRC